MDKILGKLAISRKKKILKLSTSQKKVTEIITTSQTKKNKLARNLFKLDKQHSIIKRSRDKAKQLSNFADANKQMDQEQKVLLQTYKDRLSKEDINLIMFQNELKKSEIELEKQTFILDNVTEDLKNPKINPPQTTPKRYVDLLSMSIMLDESDDHAFNIDLIDNFMITLDSNRSHPYMLDDVESTDPTQTSEGQGDNQDITETEKEDPDKYLFEKIHTDSKVVALLKTKGIKAKDEKDGIVHIIKTLKLVIPLQKKIIVLEKDSKKLYTEQVMNEKGTNKLKLKELPISEKKTNNTADINDLVKTISKTKAEGVLIDLKHKKKKLEAENDILTKQQEQIKTDSEVFLKKTGKKRMEVANNDIKCWKLKLEQDRLFWQDRRAL